jgi:hypothetical protein
MRGSTVRQLSMLSAVTPDELVPSEHPIRRVRPVVDLALGSLASTFDAMYAEDGQASSGTGGYCPVPGRGQRVGDSSLGGGEVRS